MTTLLMGLDLGTSGIKAIILDADSATPIASATMSYPLTHPFPGWAEQNPADWWQATIHVIRQGLDQLRAAGADPSDIRSIALSGQMHGAVLLDEEYQPARPCIIWADQRCQAECDWITATVGSERLIDLVSNPALPGFTAPKLIWVRNHEPEVWKRVQHVLLPKDYIRFLLTDLAAMEISDAAGTCLFDVQHGSWSQEVLTALDLDSSLLPPIIGAAEIAGTITAKVAALTGLPAGIPVAGGGADNACAAVGAGIVSPGQALVSIGTSGVVLIFSDTLQIDRSGPIPRVHTFNHAVPGSWYLMGVTQGAGLSLRWVKDQLAADAIELAHQMKRDPYDLISDIAATVAPGSDGLLFLPYLQGERTPILDSQARGGWIGLTTRHTLAHLMRAVMEGVAYSLRDCMQVLQESGTAISEVRITGGGARSKVWRQIIADVLDLPLYPLAMEEGPALGAALLAGVAAGIYPSIEAACAHIVSIDDPTYPIAAHVARYAQMYPLYQNLYPALQATMHQLHTFEQQGI